jgi:hypothetical protein
VPWLIGSHSDIRRLNCAMWGKGGEEGILVVQATIISKQNIMLQKFSRNAKV